MNERVDGCLNIAILSTNRMQARSCFTQFEDQRYYKYLHLYFVIGNVVK